MDNKRKAAPAASPERGPPSAKRFKHEDVQTVTSEFGETPASVHEIGKNFLEQIKKSKDKGGRLVATSFLTLPYADDIPEYYEEIALPLALDTIEAKIDRYEYPTVSVLEGDIRRMVQNAKDFNDKSSLIFLDAEKLRKTTSNFMVRYNPAYKDPNYVCVPTAIPGAPPGKPSTKRRASQAAAALAAESTMETGKPNLHNGSASRPLSDEEAMFAGKTLQQAQALIIQSLIEYEDEESGLHVFTPFFNLPNRALVDYYQLIKKPVSLKGTLKKVNGVQGRQAGTGVTDFKSWDAFEDEVSLIYNNAREYNEDGSEIFELANELETLFQSKLAAAKAVVDGLSQSGGQTIKLKMTTPAKSGLKIRLGTKQSPGPPNAQDMAASGGSATPGAIEKDARSERQQSQNQPTSVEQNDTANGTVPPSYISDPVLMVLDPALLAIDEENSSRGAFSPKFQRLRLIVTPSKKRSHPPASTEEITYEPSPKRSKPAAVQGILGPAVQPSPPKTFSSGITPGYNHFFEAFAPRPRAVRTAVGNSTQPTALRNIAPAPPSAPVQLTAPDPFILHSDVTPPPAPKRRRGRPRKTEQERSVRVDTQVDNFMIETPGLQKSTAASPGPKNTRAIHGASDTASPAPTAGPMADARPPLSNGMLDAATSHPSTSMSPMPMDATAPNANPPQVNGDRYTVVEPEVVKEKEQGVERLFRKEGQTEADSLLPRITIMSHPALNLPYPRRYLVSASARRAFQSYTHHIGPEHNMIQISPQLPADLVGVPTTAVPLPTASSSSPSAQQVSDTSNAVTTPEQTATEASLAAAKTFRPRPYKLFVSVNNQLRQPIAHTSSSFTSPDYPDKTIMLRQPVFDAQLLPGVNKIEVEVIAGLPQSIGGGGMGTRNAGAGLRIKTEEADWEKLQLFLHMTRS